MKRRKPTEARPSQRRKAPDFQALERVRLETLESYPDPAALNARTIEGKRLVIQAFRDYRRALDIKEKDLRRATDHLIATYEKALKKQEAD